MIPGFSNAHPQKTGDVAIGSLQIAVGGLAFINPSIRKTSAD
jgi:hypothetical protein